MTRAELLLGVAQPGAPDLLLHGAQQAVLNRDAQTCVRVHLGGAGVAQRSGGRAAISAHQPAGAKQRAAKVARDDHGRVDEILAQQHLHHRPARRAARFAVVAEAGDSAVSSQAIGEGMMVGLGMRSARCGQQRLYLGIALGAHGAAMEERAFGLHERFTSLGRHTISTHGVRARLLESG